ncbi:MAG: L-amino acid N-acyltransferase YncA [Devosia sp.]
MRPVSEIILRPFQWADVPAITAIYRHYVEHSVATFDLEAPGEDVLGEKFGHMLAAGHPVVMAQDASGKLLGYAYASVYRPRPAYRFTCENSVYCAPDATGKGLGTLLMNEIITQSRSFGFKQMIAVITAEGTGSIKLHDKLGFRHIGRHQALGYKFDRWLDIVHMQLTL